MAAGDQIERFDSESSFAEQIGFSAAVSAGGWVHVAGISAVTPDGALVGGDDAYDQMVEVLDKLKRALEACGCGARPGGEDHDVHRRA